VIFLSLLAVKLTRDHTGLHSRQDAPGARLGLESKEGSGVWLCLGLTTNSCSGADISYCSWGFSQGLMVNRPGAVQLLGVLRYTLLPLLFYVFYLIF
jgi:hypothetical protein